MNGYELSRNWFNFCFENPEKIKPNHTALYLFCVEHCNRLGWKRKFGLPTTMAKEAIGIKSYNTYINTLNELIEFGFIEMIEKSKNQYSSNIIALLNFNKAPYKALDKALDKALIKHGVKQRESTEQSIHSIDKQRNNVTMNKETTKQLTKTDFDFLINSDEFKKYCKEKGIEVKSMSKKSDFDYSDFLEKFNQSTGKKFRVADEKFKKQLRSRIKDGFSIDDIIQAAINCSNDPFHKENGLKYLTPEFITRADKLQKYFNQASTQVQPPEKPKREKVPVAFWYTKNEQRGQFHAMWEEKKRIEAELTEEERKYYRVIRIIEQ